MKRIRAWGKRFRLAAGKVRYLVRVAVPGLCVLSLAALVFFNTVPKTHVRVAESTGLDHVVWEHFDSNPLPLGTPLSKAREAVRKFIRSLPEPDRENPYFGGPVKEERSPGNYEIVEKDGRIYVRFYDKTGRPYGYGLYISEEPPVKMPH